MFMDWNIQVCSGVTSNQIDQYFYTNLSQNFNYFDETWQADSKISLEIQEKTNKRVDKANF